MKVRFTSPTEAFPFYSDVSVLTRTGWKKVTAYPTDGRPAGPALFPTKEEMIAGIKKVLA